MGIIKKVVLTFLLLCNAVLLLTAGNPTKSDNRVIRKADNLFIFCDYKNALPIYEKLAAMNPLNAQYNYRLGVCYYYSGTDVLKCLPYFETARKYFTEGDEEAIDLYYYLGTTYHMVNRFDEAIACYTRLKACILPDKQGQQDIKELEDQIAACLRGKELMKHPVNVSILNPGPSINSEFADYAPVITKDQSMLLFTSKRKECTGGRTDEDGNYYEDVFISRKQEGRDWEPSVRLDTAENNKRNFFFFSRSKTPGSINTKEHDASVALSPDGTQLYIYRLDDVWVSDYKNEKWNKPSRLSHFINSRKSHEPSVSLTMDEKTLYFVSEREGGFGGKDIYKSEKQNDGSWGIPVNLGAAINTEYDEDAPFIDSDNGVLYFSSEGHGSIGGFDVFKSKLKDGNWSAPENMGYPVNSGANDIFFAYNSRLKTGYFSSIREDGRGNYDIFIADYNPKKDKRFIKARLAVTQNGIFKNEPVYIEIRDASQHLDSLKLTNSNTDAGIYQPGATYRMTITTPSFGKYTSEFTIPENTGTENSYQEISFEEIKDSEGRITGYKTTLYNAFFNMDSAVVHTPFENIGDKAKAFSGYVHSVKGQNNPALVKSVYLEETTTTAISDKFSSILFEYDSDKFDPSYENELNKVYEYLQQNKKSGVQIIGYADSRGEEKYNLLLSERRALNVKRYLIKKGIAPSRLKIKGKGESDLLSPETNESGAHSTEAGKQNRRVEFIIWH
jgi:outer membrane protein OmpA-like peptidoglycan-associated protein/tetratricopeptide (TPR) repeat protein